MVASFLFCFCLCWHFSNLLHNWILAAKKAIYVWHSVTQSKLRSKLHHFCKHPPQYRHIGEPKRHGKVHTMAVQLRNNIHNMDLIDRCLTCSSPTEPSLPYSTAEMLSSNLLKVYIPEGMSRGHLTCTKCL